MVDLGLLIISGVLLVSFFAFGIISLYESEKRAACMFIAAGVLLPAIFISISYTDFDLLKYCLLLGTLGFLAVILVPSPFKIKSSFSDPAHRVDERDIMFSRRLLIKGTPRYLAYYENHPDRQANDDTSRSKPGLLSEKGSMFHNLSFFSSEVSFDTIKTLSGEVNGPVNPVKVDIEANLATKYLKGWAKKMGALELGICLLKEGHLYSYRGRDFNYGNEVLNQHKYAIAFTVEMDKEMMDSAPKGPTIMESARKYLDSGLIAILIARFLRRMGYEARAHIDGDYEVIAPLVARDAGLGDIGRMGLLMTPRLGPRVRIGVVTTNLDLIHDSSEPDPSMHTFCNLCKKCANVCPSRSISFEPKAKIQGIKRWMIDQESCYDYWCVTGTDCGRCMAVCPYSHPDNILHSMVRYGIKNNPIFRRLALPLDDLFYGKKPKSKDYPLWMKAR